MVVPDNGLWYPGSRRQARPRDHPVQELRSRDHAPAQKTGNSANRTLLALVLLLLLVVLLFNAERVIATVTAIWAALMGLLKQAEVYAKQAGSTDVLGFAIPLAPLVILCSYIVACVFLLPLFGVHSVSGYLYGTIPGALLVTISQTIGATCCFYIGRYLARAGLTSWLERKWGKKYRAIDAAIAEDSFKIVFLMRLSPVVPFSLTNYVAGCSQGVPVAKFAAATWLGIAPGTTFYVGLGHVMRMVEEDQMSESEREGFSKYRMYIFCFGLVATAKLLHLASQRATKLLEEAGFQDDPATDTKRTE